MAAKPTLIYKQVSKYYREILTGTVLAVDPSTGSAGSMPGYSVFIGGELKDSGIIKVDPTLPQHRKLHAINRVLREEFPYPDVMVVEDIPNVRFRNAKNNIKGGMDSRAIGSLQRAVGAISCAFDCQGFILVHPRAWQTSKFAGYVKSDENDAICLGLAVINTANKILTERGEEI